MEFVWHGPVRSRAEDVRKAIKFVCKFRHKCIYVYFKLACCPEITSRSGKPEFPQSKGTGWIG